MISGDTALTQGKKGAFYNTLEEFHKYWDRIDIITPKTNQKIDNIFGNVFIHSSNKNKVFQPWFIKEKGVEIYSREKFDVITVHEYPPFYNGIGARLLWQKIKVPYILEIMHVPGHPKAASFKERLYKFLTKMFINFDSKKAKAIRVVNKKEIPELLMGVGVKKEKLVNIPAFYIDLETFRPMEVEKKYDLVFAARLEKNKGIINLIKAVEIIKEKKPDTSLLIIGSGPLKKSIQEYIKDNDLEKNVHLSGWLETLNDVARAYNSARVFINPSFNEGGPRVVLEAMACGLPVVTTRVGLSLDIVKDGENGLFIDWSPNDVANKINDLLNNQKMQDKFSCAGLELVKKFSKEPAIRNYADKLKDLIV